MNTIDVRGLSCPQPVIVTLEEIEKVQKGRFEVLVDTDTSKENVMRAVKTRGWQIKDIQKDNAGYCITIVKD